MPVPQTQAHIGEVVKVLPRERVLACIRAQIVAIPAPQVLEETLKVKELVPQERIHEYTVQEVIDVTVSQVTGGYDQNW